MFQIVHDHAPNSLLQVSLAIGHDALMTVWLQKDDSRLYRPPPQLAERLPEELLDVAPLEKVESGPQ